MWLKDPKTNEASVSLTAFVISFLLASVLIVLNSFDKIKTVSYAMELFGICVGLYFSRRNITIGKTSVSLGEEEVKK